MNITSKFASAILIGLAASSMMVAGCPSDDDCTLDADCESGNVCEAEVCTPTCDAAADDCADGETCAARPSGGDGTICVTDGTTPPDGTCDQDADPDAFCVTETGDPDATCDTAAMVCVTPDAPVGPTVIQIFDTSSGPDACDNAMAAGERDAGSDISWVALRNGTGDLLAYGTQVAVSDADSTNFYNNASILDGSTPTLRSGGPDTCPEGEGNTLTTADNIYSLGCGGSVFIEFRGSDNMAIAIEQGFQIEVSEYANRCFATPGDDADGNDTYDVLLCADASAASGGDGSSCSTSVGADLKGFTTNTVSMLPAADGS